jgi:hypothetical protein
VTPLRLVLEFGETVELDGSTLYDPTAQTAVSTVISRMPFRSVRRAPARSHRSDDQHVRSLAAAVQRDPATRWDAALTQRDEEPR